MLIVSVLVIYFGKLWSLRPKKSILFFEIIFVFQKKVLHLQRFDM